MPRTVPGSGAIIEPIFNSIFGVREVYVIDGGNGYNSSDPPQLKVGNCGTPIREAVLQPIISNGQIASVRVLDPGEGYDPFRIELETEGDGHGAVAKAILYEQDELAPDGTIIAPAGSIQYIQVLSNGDEYYSSPTTAEVKGGGGSGAELRPVVGLVTGLSLENQGSNYELGDINLVVSGGGGQGATGVAEVDEFGVVKSIDVSNVGEFYETAPTILLNGGGGSGSVAKANIDLGSITSIDVINPGGGYSSAPSVLFTRNTDLTKESRNRQSFNSNLYNISGLLADVDENDQTIYVQTTAPYPGSGKILIGREVIRYTGKTLTSFTGCDRALNFRYDQKVTVDSLADVNGVSGYNFNVGDRVIRTTESSSNKIARVYDWIPSQRALFLVFEVDELAFIDGGSSQVKSQVIDFSGGVASASATGVEPHVLIDLADAQIITLTVPISFIQDKAFEDDDEASGAGDGIPDLVNTNTDFEGEINLDGGISSSLYGIEETVGGTNTTLFAIGDQMTDGSNPPLSPTVSLAGELGDGDVHPALVQFQMRSTNPENGNFTVSETVTGSITGITATVKSWDNATKILIVENVVGNSGNFLWNNNETVTGGSTGTVGTPLRIEYLSYLRNEPD
tara:strand:- start:12445 stop:14316 length:1872 start_codon:yes stop_codon:yes gene_type:complete